MIKNLFIISLLVLISSGNLLKGETFSHDIGQFEKIKVNGNVNVVYRNLPDSTGIARFEGKEGFDKAFTFEVKKDGTLKIQVSDAYWANKDLPTIYLYSDFLSSVENSSELTLKVESLAPCASFNANQIGNGTILVEGIRSNNVSASLTTGNGTVNLSGKCVSATFRMVGAGLISADRLQAENVNCNILGTGSIGCWPIDNLNVKGLGTTKIYYKGDPNIKKTGGGKLFQLPEESVEEIYDRQPDPAPAFIEEKSETVVTATDDEDEDAEEEEEEEEEDDDDDDDDDNDEEEEDDENNQTVVTADD